MAMLAINSISITERNGTPTEEEPLVPAKLGNMTLEAATTKAVFYTLESAKPDVKC